MSSYVNNIQGFCVGFWSPPHPGEDNRKDATLYQVVKNLKYILFGYETKLFNTSVHSNGATLQIACTYTTNTTTVSAFFSPPPSQTKEKRAKVAYRAPAALLLLFTKTKTYWKNCEQCNVFFFAAPPSPLLPVIGREERTRQPLVLGESSGKIFETKNQAEVLNIALCYFFLLCRQSPASAGSVLNVARRLFFTFFFFFSLHT